MKSKHSQSKLPPVVNGSSAVRVGGSALQIARQHATRNGLTLRATIEAILLQLGEQLAHPPAAPVVAIEQGTKRAKVAKKKAERIQAKGGVQ